MLARGNSPLPRDGDARWRIAPGEWRATSSYPRWPLKGDAHSRSGGRTPRPRLFREGTGGIWRPCKGTAMCESGATQLARPEALAKAGLLVATAKGGVLGVALPLSSRHQLFPVAQSYAPVRHSQLVTCQLWALAAMPLAIALSISRVLSRCLTRREQGNKRNTNMTIAYDSTRYR